MGIDILAFTLFTFLPVFIITTVISFIVGTIWSHQRYKKYIKEIGCPFKHACLYYNSIETKDAVKRVLTLMLDNHVPVSEIKDIINKTLK